MYHIDSYVYIHIIKCVFNAIGNCGSAHQAPSLPSSASLPEGRGQLKHNTNDDDINVDTKPAEMSEENESNLNIFGDVQENAQTGTAESQQKKLQNNDHHGIAYS